MAKALMVAYSSAVPGRDDDYDRWYEEVHVPDVRAALPTVTSVNRYRLVDLEGGGAATRYLAVYELGDADVAAAAAQLGAAAQAGRLRRTDTMDTTDNPPELQWFVNTADDSGS